MLKTTASDLAVQPRGGPRFSLLGQTAQMSDLIGKILPSIVAHCDRPDEAGNFSLHPRELEAIDALHLPIDRQAQFELGRRCAHAAMAKLGRTDMPVLIDRQGAPVWPAGIVGSITHAPGYCAAAVARAHNFHAIGINAEAWQQFPTDIAEDISIPWEIDAMEPTIDIRLKLGVLFSAKQSIFKALRPVVQRDFDFRSVALKVDFADRNFRIVSVDSPDLDRLKNGILGAFSVTKNVLLTSALLYNSGQL